jgi:adenylate kinase
MLRNILQKTKKKKTNLSLIGPPGSGKGSYGRHLAEALQIPLITISDVLRSFRPDLDLSSGQLIDDHVVCDALLERLLLLKKRDGEDDEPNQNHHGGGAGGYILDGFPRTLQQAHLMQEHWPESYQVQAAIKLAVPDRVCEVKLLGRRLCTICGGNYNINGVVEDDTMDNTNTNNGWYLPPSLPKEECTKCHPDKDWSIREDDTPPIVKERLKVYHQHMDPILDYFGSQNSLLTLTPYKGYEDLPMLISAVQCWIEDDTTTTQDDETTEHE